MKRVTIQFNPEMMRANLGGTKTQVRRRLDIKYLHYLVQYGEDESEPSDWGYLWDGKRVTLDTLVPAQPGDVLCGRETIQVVDIHHTLSSRHHTLSSRQVRVKYEADGAISGWIDWPARLRGLPTIGRRLSSPHEFCRFIRPLVDVKIERIRSITEEDCQAEGCAGPPHGPALAIFPLFWNAFYRGSWERNDWVVVYKYPLEGVGP